MENVCDRYGLEVVAALWQKGLLDTIVIVTQYEEIIYAHRSTFSVHENRE